jgi:hypothetical protein
VEGDDREARRGGEEAAERVGVGGRPSEAEVGAREKEGTWERREEPMGARRGDSATGEEEEKRGERGGEGERICESRRT